MIEDIPDHRLVLDETDDPHGPLTFRADQGICFVYLLNQPGPTFPEHLVPEDGFQFLQFKGWRDAEHVAITIKTAIRDEDVAVWIESEEIAEGLDSDDGAGDGIVFRNCILEKDLHH